MKVEANNVDYSVLSANANSDYAGILVTQIKTADLLGNPPPTPTSCTPAPPLSQNNLIFANSGSPNEVLGIARQCGAALSNAVEANDHVDGGTCGVYDGNLNCDANSWSDDILDLRDQPCVK